MSKLSENIRAVQLDVRYVLNEPFKIDSHYNTDYLSSGSIIGYELSAWFGVQARIEDKPNNGELLAFHKDLARRQIIEKVFGEFRGPLLEVERALANYDYQRALKGIQAIQHQMFNT